VLCSLHVFLNISFYFEIISWLLSYQSVYSNVAICCRRWLLGKLFEEICLDDVSSCSSYITHRRSGTKSSSVARASHSHSDVRHCAVLRELSVCHIAADRYHSNYNAWNHRVWVMDKFTCCRLQVCAVLSTSMLYDYCEV